jgi:hypothetical protein
MRRPHPPGTIEFMLIHPSIHLDVARERERKLIARAERQRLADASRPAAGPQLRSVARSVAHQEVETLMKNTLSTGERVAGDALALTREENQLGMEPHHPGHAPPRELAFRGGNRLEVTLLWNAEEDLLTVSVYDPTVPEFFEVPAPSDRALEVFYHPYAYAAQRGIEYGASALEIEDTADV